MGPKNRAISMMNAANAPTCISPLITNIPPTTITRAVASAEIVSTTGMNADTMAPARTLASTFRRLVRSNAAALRSSRTNDCAVRTPSMLSCKSPYTLPTVERTWRNAARAQRLKYRLASHISGSTARLTSASRQSNPNIIPTMISSIATSPTSDVTPSVTNSLITSTSFVMRDITAPSGCRLK